MTAGGDGLEGRCWAQSGSSTENSLAILKTAKSIKESVWRWAGRGQMACQRGFSRSLGSELLVGEAERTKTYMSCAEHLANRQTCLKESFNPDPTSNYVDVKPEQLELVTVDQFYISTHNRRLRFGTIQTLSWNEVPKHHAKLMVSFSFGTVRKSGQLWGILVIRTTT